MQRGRRQGPKRLTSRGGPAQLRVAVVGAGVAGLCCARRLLASNNAVHVDVFEKSLSVGGRVRTDFVPFDACKLQRSTHACNGAVEGFQLDVGFQVLLTGYPTVPKIIDIKALHTRSFGQGAVLAGPNSTPQLLVNPLLHPRLLWQTLKTFLSWGLWRSLLDIFLIVWHFVCGWIMSSAYERLHKLCALKSNAQSFLRRRVGLSRSIVECFFRPFFGTLLLEFSPHVRQTCTKLFKLLACILATFMDR